MLIKIICIEKHSQHLCYKVHSTEGKKGEPKEKLIV